MSFSALAFLLAVVAVFIELNRDRIVVERKHYARLKWGMWILAAETLAWMCIELARLIPVSVLPSSSLCLKSITAALLLGVAAATLLLASFVSHVGKLVFRGYQ